MKSFKSVDVKQVIMKHVESPDEQAWKMCGPYAGPLLNASGWRPARPKRTRRRMSKCNLAYPTEYFLGLAFASQDGNDDLLKPWKQCPSYLNNYYSFTDQ